ncbi:MAG TPA: TonB family protein [Verrucomicrobiota bacterium]|nr:hypothetical protein [Verrucomicrobiales bacterium]HRI12645.1 TonB family protein [Verrucomicrobiota bacterium]
MSAHAATSSLPEYRITSELNRQSLPGAERDPDRKVAWMNAICVLVLAVGLLMTDKPAELAFTPEIYEPPQTIELPRVLPETKPEIQDLKVEEVTDFEPVAQPTVVVVAADASKVPFAVPVVGATLVSSDLRQVSAPPKLLVIPKPPPLMVLKFTERANHGDLPWPTDKDYPPEARARKEQGDVVMVVDVSADGGAPTEVTIERPAESDYLNRAARDWVRTKWKFFPGQAKRLRFMFSYTLGL